MIVIKNYNFKFKLYFSFEIKLCHIFQMRLSILRSTKMTFLNTDMFSCQSIPTKSYLEGGYWLNKSGDQLECSNQEAGFIMKSTNLNLSSYCLEDLWEQTLLLECLLEITLLLSNIQWL